MMKAEFMTLWDGLASSSSQIVVLGATNRPGDIDAAFLRRMPKRFRIGMPDAKQRTAILERMLGMEPTVLGSDRIAKDVNLSELGALTNGFSGSDLKELCRNTLMVPIQEAYRRYVSSSATNATTTTAAAAAADDDDDDDVVLNAESASVAREKMTVRPVSQLDFIRKIDEMMKARIPDSSNILYEFE